MAALTDANYALVFLFASLYAHLPGLDLVRVVTFKLAFLASVIVISNGQRRPPLWCNSHVYNVKPCKKRPVYSLPSLSPVSLCGVSLQIDIC